MHIEPFRIEVPEADLDDLRRRIRATRWPDRGPVADWSQGVPLGADCAEAVTAHAGWRAYLATEG